MPCYAACPAASRHVSIASRSALWHSRVYSTGKGSTPLTLLHKTCGLLPRVLPSKATQPEHSFEFWDHILSHAYKRSVNGHVEILVHGLDEWSQSRELVSALLDEPFSSDESRRIAVRERWADTAEDHVLLEYGEATASIPPSLRLPSPFFLRLPVPVRIRETSPSLSGSQLSEAYLTSDIPIIICNPVSISPATFLSHQYLSHNPKTIFAFVTPPLPNEALRRLYPRLSKLNMVTIEPARALAALEAVQGNPDSPVAVQLYQDEFIASRMSTLAETLDKVLSSSSATISSQTVLSQITAALESSREYLCILKKELDSISRAVSELEGTTEEARVKAQADVFGKESQGEVEAALKQATRDMHAVMDKLTWWKLIWRADEVTVIVYNAVAAAWCRGLETRLIYHAGRLSVLQRSLQTSTLSLLSSHNSTIQSPVLENTLLQIISAPSYNLMTESLTAPMRTRRDQIVEFPTARLHVAGQRAVLLGGGSVVAGALTGWAGWVGWLVGEASFGLDAGTSMGVGALGALLGVRWSIRIWEKAKRRWWADWDRVGQGLKRDLTKTLASVLDEQVTIVATTGCSGLSSLVEKRREEIADVEDELHTLEKEVNSNKEVSS